MYGFMDGYGVEELEYFQNAHGFSSIVFSFLTEKYLGESGLKAWPKLWETDLPKRFEPYERDVLQGAYDFALIRREDFNRFADRLEQFSRYVDPKVVNHLPVIAKTMREALDLRTPIIAIGFSPISVVPDHWIIRDPDYVDGRFYDLKRDKGHFFVELEPDSDTRPAHWRQETPKDQAIAIISSIEGWLSLLDQGATNPSKAVDRMAPLLQELKQLTQTEMLEPWKKPKAQRNLDTFHCDLCGDPLRSHAFDSCPKTSYPCNEPQP